MNDTLEEALKTAALSSLNYKQGSMGGEEEEGHGHTSIRAGGHGV